MSLGRSRSGHSVPAPVTAKTGEGGESTILDIRPALGVDGRIGIVTESEVRAAELTVLGVGLVSLAATLQTCLGRHGAAAHLLCDLDRDDACGHGDDAVAENHQTPRDELSQRRDRRDIAVPRGGPHPLDRCSSQLRWNPGS